MLLLARRVGRWPERIGDVGVVRDTAIHDIDLARYIFADEVQPFTRNLGACDIRRRITQRSCSSSLKEELLSSTQTG